MQRKNQLSMKLYFRKFSRKAYAVFNSLKRVVHISKLAVAYSLIVSPFKLSAQTDSVTFLKIIDLEEVEIVGQVSPGLSDELPRQVRIITSSDSECAPLQSIIDILRFSGNVDLRQRGKGGIQSDLSIRGGSFDHNLILFNGINISDPQTGHLSLNLPVETYAIDRIEILNGPASRVHGANATGGAVNISTKPGEGFSLDVSSTFGEYGYMNNSITTRGGSQKIKNLLHYNNALSSGYLPNTDYFRQGAFYQGQLMSGKSRFEIQMGGNSRSFGSNGFYTPKYPDQFESNRLLLMAIGYRREGRIRIRQDIYWRRHKDHWEMFREDENWYRVENGQSVSNDTNRTHFDTAFVFTNHHLNDAGGIRTDLSLRTAIGTSSLGLHLRSERILSTNIGYDSDDPKPVRGFEGLEYTHRDSRSTADIHFEQTIHFWRVYVSGGALLNWNSYLPDKIGFFPGLDIKFSLTDKFSLVGSYNQSLGLPTFTDLTYNDPNNQGSDDLRPYSQHSFEGGVKAYDGGNVFSMIVFMTLGRDVIDWVWFEDEERFSPVNIDHYRSRGFEFYGKLTLPEGSMISRIFSNLKLGYTFIDMDKEVPGEILKYFNLRHKGSLILNSQPLRDLNLAIYLSYTVREGSYLTYDFKSSTYLYNTYKPYFLADIRLSYSLWDFTFFVEAANLFNVQYIDIGSIMQPGRWISGGVKYSFNLK